MKTLPMNWRAMPGGGTKEKTLTSWHHFSVHLEDTSSWMELFLSAAICGVWVLPLIRAPSRTIEFQNWRAIFGLLGVGSPSLGILVLGERLKSNIFIFFNSLGLLEKNIKVG